MTRSTAQAANGEAPAAGEALFAYLLRLGDNALVFGQRLGEWCRNGPTLEEDMALTNFALDHIGQARLLLSYAGEVEGRGRDEDALAFLREERDYHNLLLLELPNGDFGHTIVRLFFYSAFLHGLYGRLAGSADERVAAIAAKAVKEMAYQLRHAGEWMVRLGDGTDESHGRMVAALEALWPYTHEMFLSDEVEQAMAAARIGAEPALLKPGWDAIVDDVLARATLARPGDGWVPQGGKQGRHSEHFGHMLAELQYMQRAYPGCEW